MSEEKGSTQTSIKRAALAQAKEIVSWSVEYSNVGHLLEVLIAREHKRLKRLKQPRSD